MAEGKKSKLSEDKLTAWAAACDELKLGRPRKGTKDYARVLELYLKKRPPPTEDEARMQRLWQKASIKCGADVDDVVTKEHPLYGKVLTLYRELDEAMREATTEEAPKRASDAKGDEPVKAQRRSAY